MERAASPAALPVAAHGGDWETPTPSGSRVSRSEQTPEPRAADSSQDLRSGSARRSATPVSRSTTPRAEAGGRNRHGFRGVRQRPWGPYAAEIRDATSGKRRWVGTFNSAAEAARAYDAAALALHGAMTRTNFKYSRATLAQYPAYVPRNDAAAAAALQAVISGAAELPVPDDPLYAEALEAELAAAAAGGGGTAAGGSSGGGAAAHRSEHRRTPRAGSATPPARGRTASPAPVELHGMPISVPPVRTSSMGIGAQAGAVAAALHLKQLLAAAASDAPSGDSPPHSDSHAASSAVRFQLDAAGGSGSFGEPVRRGGSPGVAASLPTRSRLGGSRGNGTGGGDDGFGCNGSSDGGAMLGMGKAARDAFDCGQHYSCASGSPSGFHASGFSPQLGRPQPSASETPHSNGLSAAAGHFAAQSAQQPALPGAADTAGAMAGEDEGGNEHAAEEPMAADEEARPADNAGLAPAATEGEQQGLVAQTDVDPAPAEADTQMAEATVGVAAAGGPAVREDAAKAGAAPSGLQLDASAREALLRALMQRRQEAAAAMAARAAAAAAAQQQQQQQAAAALDALQRRNASTIASLKSLAGVVGSRAMASMLPSLTKLPAVQLLLKSIQTAAPTLVATVEAEQRVAEQQRVALVHRTSELQRLLLAQLGATPGVAPPLPAAAAPLLPPLLPRRQPGAPAAIDGPSGAAVAVSAAAGERAVAEATAAIGRQSDEDATLAAAAAAAGIPALWKAPAPDAAPAASAVAQPPATRAEPGVTVPPLARAAAPALEPLPGSPALAGAPSPVSTPGTPTSPSAASVAAVAAANKTQLLQLLLAQRQQTLHMQQAGQRQLLGLLGQQRAQLAALKGLVASSPKAGPGPALQDLSLSPVAKRRRLEDAPAAAAVAAATAGEAAAKGQGIGAVSSGNLDALAAAAELFG